MIETSTATTSNQRRRSRTARRSHGSALMQAEVRRLLRVLRSHGTLPHDTLVRLGRPHSREVDIDVALHDAAHRGEIAELGAGSFAAPPAA